MEPLLREGIADALQELSDELKRARVKAHLYLVGGAAIAMAFRDSRRTYDLDVLITEGHGPVVDETRRIARRRGWPETWLNEQAASSIPKLPDRRAATLYGSSNLVVTGASAEHLLAMKVRAGRQIDLPDIALLTDSLGHTRGPGRLCRARSRVSGRSDSGEVLAPSGGLSCHALAAGLIARMLR